MKNDLALAVQHRNKLLNLSSEAHKRGERNLGTSLFREATNLYAAVIAVRNGKDINLDRELVAKAIEQEQSNG